MCLRPGNMFKLHSYELSPDVLFCIHVQGPNAHMRFFLPSDDIQNNLGMHGPTQCFLVEDNKKMLSRFAFQGLSNNKGVLYLEMMSHNHVILWCLMCTQLVFQFQIYTCDLFPDICRQDCHWKYLSQQSVELGLNQKQRSRLIQCMSSVKRGAK